MAMIYELDLDFGYDKQIYGTNRENSIVSRSYSAGVSAYVFSTTAIDFNYSYSKDITTNNDQYNISGYTVDHVSDQSRVTTTVYGIGLKQMLAPKGSWIMPLISFGYAREFVTSQSDATYKNTATDVLFVYNSLDSKQIQNSVFGSFILQFHLTDALSLKGSIKTLFPAFDYNKARDNIKYSFGFSWLF